MNSSPFYTFSLKINTLFFNFLKKGKIAVKNRRPHYRLRAHAKAKTEAYMWRTVVRGIGRWVECHARLYREDTGAGRLPINRIAPQSQ
jgi:hypothetical protein